MYTFPRQCALISQGPIWMYSSIIPGQCSPNFFKRDIFKMTITVIICFTFLSITTWTRSTAIYTQRSISGSAVCAVGQALDLQQQLEEMSTRSCVPLSVRCAFTCQQHAPNCTCFNYYENECCDFFSGSIVYFPDQPGCTLWAVTMTIGYWKIVVAYIFNANNGNVSGTWPNYLKINSGKNP